MLGRRVRTEADEVEVVRTLGVTHAGSRGGFGVLVARMIRGSKAGGRIVFVAGDVTRIAVMGGPRPTCATGVYVLPVGTAPAARTEVEDTLVDVRRGRGTVIGEAGENDMEMTFSMLRVEVLVGMGMLDDRFGRVDMAQETDCKERLLEENRSWFLKSWVRI